MVSVEAELRVNWLKAIHVVCLHSKEY